MTSLEQRILRLGLDDWLHFVELVDEVRAADPDAPGEILRDRAMSVLGNLLGEGLIEIGDVHEVDGFRPWRVTRTEALDQIRREWDRLGRSLSIGDICWLSNTEAGDRLAASVGS